MTDYRSAAEKFVTEFLDYVNQYDIQDEFDKKTQKMVRSAGVSKLIQQASTVFPPRVAVGKVETDAITNMDEVIAESKNVIDRRDDFSRKIQQNGAARGLLEKLVTCPPEETLSVMLLAQEFIAAEKGEKEFYVPADKE